MFWWFSSRRTCRNLWGWGLGGGECNWKKLAQELLNHHLPCPDRAGRASSQSQANYLECGKAFSQSLLPSSPPLTLSFLAPHVPQAFIDSIFTEEIAAFFAYWFIWKSRSLELEKWPHCCSLSVKQHSTFLVCVYCLPLELDVRLSGNGRGLLWAHPPEVHLQPQGAPRNSLCVAALATQSPAFAVCPRKAGIYDSGCSNKFPSQIVTFPASFPDFTVCLTVWEQFPSSSVWQVLVLW